MGNLEEKWSRFAGDGLFLLSCWKTDLDLIKVNENVENEKC